MLVVVDVVVLVVLVELPLIIEEIAAAKAAVKFGSAVMAAVAALRESTNDAWC